MPCSEHFGELWISVIDFPVVFRDVKLLIVNCSPRDGRNIKPYQFIQALQDGYNLSYLCAAFLTWGSFIVLSQWRHVSLKDIGRHNCVEHDASLLHRDPVRGKEYAPADVCPLGMKTLAKYAGTKRRFTAEDLATARVDRESEYPVPLDDFHATIGK